MLFFVSSLALLPLIAENLFRAILYKVRDARVQKFNLSAWIMVDVGTLRVVRVFYSSVRSCALDTQHHSYINPLRPYRQARITRTLTNMYLVSAAYSI